MLENKKHQLNSHNTPITSIVGWIILLIVAVFTVGAFYFARMGNIIFAIFIFLPVILLGVYFSHKEAKVNNEKHTGFFIIKGVVSLMFFLIMTYILLG